MVHIVEQRTTLHVLQDEIDVLLVAYTAVELDDVGVADVGMQLYLLDELVDHVHLFGLGLDDLLEGADEPGGYMST